MSATTLEVGQQLVALCNQGNGMEAVNTLYADDIVSVEARGDDQGPMPRQMTGLDAVRGKSEWWYANHDVHGGTATGPFPHDDRFIVHFKFDVTPRIGPNAGERMTIEEAALYTVNDGKVVREEFFYDM